MTASPLTPVPRGLANLPFGSDFEAHGCSVNAIGVEQLFAKYESCGFLYPAKRERLKPVWGLIAENWERSMRARDGEFLHSVVCYGGVDSGAWASVSYWATTNRTVHSQHLVSVGRPEASRAVLLSAQSDSHRRGHQGSQNWFRAENRYPARVFGSCTLSLGPANASVQQLRCLSIDRGRLPEIRGKARVERVVEADGPALDRLARRICGEVQSRVDEWAAGDIDLTMLDRRYAAVGLRRYRAVFVATMHDIAEPVGLAVAYRGPLGLNFSFLENRCELWMDPRLPSERHAETVSALVRAAAPIYDKFELPSLLVTADASATRELLAQGALPLQDYSRSVWLRDGYPAWYTHVNGFYARVLAAANRGARDDSSKGPPHDAPNGATR